MQIKIFMNRQGVVNTEHYNTSQIVRVPSPAELKNCPILDVLLLTPISCYNIPGFDSAVTVRDGQVDLKSVGLVGAYCGTLFYVRPETNTLHYL